MNVDDSVLSQPGGSTGCQSPPMPPSSTAFPLPPSSRTPRHQCRTTTTRTVTHVSDVECHLCSGSHPGAAAARAGEDVGPERPPKEFGPGDGAPGRPWAGGLGCRCPRARDRLGQGRRGGRSGDETGTHPGVGGEDVEVAGNRSGVHHRRTSECPTRLLPLRCPVPILLVRLVRSRLCPGPLLQRYRPASPGRCHSADGAEAAQRATRGALRLALRAGLGLRSAWNCALAGLEPPPPGLLRVGCSQGRENASP
jgi:hypothetical protein